jgi:hypothetical protein
MVNSVLFLDGPAGIAAFKLDIAIPVATDGADPVDPHDRDEAQAARYTQEYATGILTAAVHMAVHPV